MVLHERIADQVYWFQSDVYAQVTAGAVIGPEWAVLIDTLALPEETLFIRDFIERELAVPVRYVLLTHYHADHAWGSCLFPGAMVIAHQRTRALLLERGVPALEEARRVEPSFKQLKIVLPHFAFHEGTFTLTVGKKHVRMFALPGHSPDGTGVLVEEDRVLFAGDVFMPLPYLVDGDYDEMVASLKRIKKMGLENVVQGHGDLILRGEIEQFLEENLDYLSAIRKVVRRAHRRKYPRDLLDEVTVEECGKSRVLLGGLASELHQRNLRALYRQMYGEAPQASPEEEYEY